MNDIVKKLEALIVEFEAEAGKAQYQEEVSFYEAKSLGVQEAIRIIKDV